MSVAELGPKPQSVLPLHLFHEMPAPGLAWPGLACEGKHCPLLLPPTLLWREEKRNSGGPVAWEQNLSLDVEPELNLTLAK